MDELNKLGDERRRGLLTLEALRTGGASIAVLDAQLGQVEKVLQVMSKSADVRDRCMEDMLRSQKVSNDQNKKIEELQNVVAKLEAKVLLMDTRLCETEKIEKASGGFIGNTAAMVYKEPSQVPAGGAHNSRTRNASMNADVVDSAHGRRGSGPSTNSGAIMFAAAVRGVKEKEPPNQRAADAFRERVRNMSGERSSETDCLLETPGSGESAGVMTGMESNWRTSSTTFKTDAPEFRPQNPVRNFATSVVAVLTNVNNQTFDFEEPLEPPKLVKPKRAAVIPEPDVKPPAPESTVIKNTACPEETVRSDGPRTSVTGEVSRNSDVASIEKKTTEADEEAHPEEDVIRKQFIEPMFREPLGVTTEIESFIGRIKEDAEVMDWAPFMKVLWDLGTKTRATARKAFEIYEVMVEALANGDQDVFYLRRPLLQQCQKMFKKALDNVRSNCVDQECLEATLWLMAYLYTWENFGNKREILGLAVCEILANLAKKTVAGMTIADSLTAIKELMEFMMRQLKTDGDSKLEKQILDISKAVVVQLSTFGSRMYKEQELARNILMYVDSLVKPRSDDSEEVEWS